MTTALLGIAGIAGLFVAFALVYLLRWVLLIGGFVGMALGLIFLTGYAIQGDAEPGWMAWGMLGSGAATFVGMGLVDA